MLSNNDVAPHGLHRRRAAAVWLLWLMAAAAAVRPTPAAAAAAAGGTTHPSWRVPALGLPPAVVAGAGAVTANDRLTVAVTSSAQGAAAGLRVLRRDGRAWQAAGAVEAPPDADATTFGKAGLAMSSDGRVLAVGATAQPFACEEASTTGLGSSSNATLGYVYRAAAHPTDVLTYALTQRLSVDVRAAAAAAACAPGPAATNTRAAMIMPRFDLARDGQAAVVCYTTVLQQQQQPQLAGQHGGPTSSSSGSRSGGAAVISVPADPRQPTTTHVLPVPRGSQGFGSDCKASGDGRVVLVVDADQGAMVYSRHAQASTTAQPRASGWLPGGAPGLHYRVLAAALSPAGTRAALAVQRRSAAPPGQVVLRVFAADALGGWALASACDIAVDEDEALVLMAAGSGSSDSAAGRVSLSLADVEGGGIHVTVGAAAEGGGSSTPQGARSSTYFVGLAGSQATHCPQLPVMRATGRSS